MLNTGFRLDSTQKKPLYRQLAEAILKQISAGALIADERLPAIRKLADAVGVNPRTVVKALKHLEQEGYVYSKVGSGTYVAYSQFTVPRINKAQMVNETHAHRSKQVIDFATASPSPELFPIEKFRQVIDEVLDRDRGRAFTYQDVEGYAPLRETIAQMLLKENIKVASQQILITSGSQQGIDILAKALLQPKDTVVLEEPSYDGAIAVFRSRGATIKSIPLTPDGLDCVMLEDVLKRYNIQFVYLMPDFQNPTGGLTSLTTRKKLLQLANDYDFLIVEDAHVRDLRYTGSSLPSIKSMDTDDRVIYLRSFSKVFMPGLRLAYMIVPKRIYSFVYATKQLTDISTTGLSQRAFELYLKKGMWDDHLFYLKSIFQERHKIMLSMLQGALPKEVGMTPPQGGLYFWLQLPADCDSKKLTQHLHSKKVNCVSGEPFYAQRDKLNAIRLSFAAAFPGEIIKGVEILTHSIKDFL